MPDLQGKYIRVCDKIDARLTMGNFLPSWNYAITYPMAIGIEAECGVWKPHEKESLWFIPKAFLYYEERLMFFDC